MNGILEEMRVCVRNFEEQGKLVEAQRLFQRVNYDVEMLQSWPTLCDPIDSS